MKKSHGSYRYTIIKKKRIPKIHSILSRLFIFLMIINFFFSDFIYNNLWQFLQNDGINGANDPKTSTAPDISVYLPSNYSLYGKIASNYSISITGGPGNYTWYEFLETGEKSTPIKLNGLLNEDVNDTFDQNMWDNLSNGTVTIRFYANDSLNSIGYTDAIIRVDIIAPGKPNTLAAIPSLWTNTDNYNLSWSNPSEASGIIGAYYKLNEAPMFDTDGTYIEGANIESILEISVITEGTHDVYVWLVDAAGNVNYSAHSSTQLYLDSSDPTAPISLVATPSSWTSTDSFNLSWSNPSDTSEIVGAYYKLDIAPMSDTDGTYIEGVNIESILDVSVITEGMHDVYVWLVDAAGNVNYSAHSSTQLYLDSSDPTAPISLVATPSSWTSTDSFNLSWSNPSDTSGIVGAYYKLNEAPTSDDDGTYVAGTNIESISDISVLTEGTHDVYVWLVDVAGNVNYSTYASTQLHLDSSDPSTPSMLLATPSSWTNIDSFNLSWSNPFDTSGIVGAYYKLDIAPTSDDDGTYIAGPDIESILDISVLTEGTHNIFVWLVDAAGNVNYSIHASTQLYLDTSISSPSTLVATPSSWTNIDSFNLSWSNPSDTSGIVGAYYKLDIAPTSDDDGTYVAGPDIESILDISVLTEGTHPVYVWLVDATGNVDYNTHASTQLYLDTSDPSSPSMLVATPSSWTNIDSFNLSWSNPSDTSEIVGAYYKLDFAPTSDDDGTYVAGPDIESILDISVLTEETHNIFVWLVDAAGNVNYSIHASTYLYLDTSDPSAPSSLVATPPSWTNIDSFNISWENPSDISGIVGAYYKLNNAPTSDDDGTYVEGANIESITDISVLTEGTHDVYVWLVDAAENVNYSIHASTQLYLDTSISSPSTLVATPSSWTNIDNFNLSWSNPSDTSGVVGAYYKLDIAPISDDDGTYVAGPNIESILDISVLTEGTHPVYVWLVDATGNVDYNNHASTQLYLDTSDPSSPSTLVATPSSWTNIDSFNLSWSNPSDTSGVVGAYYKLDFAPTSDDDGIYVAGTNIQSIYDISVLSEGTHDVYVWLVDAAGNVNYTIYASVQLYLDTTDPSIPSSLVATPSSWTNVDSFNISWLNPSDTSGIVGAYYKLDFAPTSDDDGTYVAGADIESILGISVLTEGTHYIFVWLVDAAGNTDYINSVFTQLYLDATDPAAPSTLLATPSSWTNLNSFNISWVNPSDTSGVAGAYYKLDIAPLSDADGFYVAGTNITSILNISVLSDGTHPVYVWLVDEAGNVDFNNYISTILYLDSSDPSIPNVLTASPNLWTNLDSFNISWENPLDTSGIAGAYYKLDLVPTFDTDGIYVEGVDIESIIGISVLSDGTHPIYVWLVDEAGNLDFNNHAMTQLYLDTSKPLIIDFQEGDDTWRNTTGTTYNIDFSDSLPSSNLDSAQYKITNAPSQEGDLIKDWTYIFTDLGSISYTINWTIEFAVCQEGINYISVRVYDKAGNLEMLNDVFYIKKDTFNPLIIDSQTGDDIWRDSGGTTYNIDFSDSIPSSNLDFAQYRITSETDQGGIVLKEWTNIFINLGTTDYTMDWSINFTACQEGINYISVRVYDKAGNIAILNDVFYVKKDTIDPIVIVNHPLNKTYWNSSPPINVSVIEPNLASLTYTVIGYFPINNWLENNTEELLNEDIWNDLPQGEFLIVFTSFDSLGHNSEVIITLYKDTYSPILLINAPENNTYWNSPPFLNVTAFDPNLDTIWYSVNNINITLSNNTLQQLNLSVWDILPDEGEFEVHFYANDSFGYMNDKFTLTLYKDIKTPSLIINSPFNNTYWNAPPIIKVTVIDSYLHTIWYRVGSIVVALSNNTNQQLNTSIWESLPEEGEFMIYFYANDTSGNLNDIYALRLNKDILNPSITINNPKKNDLFGDIAPNFDISIIEANLNHSWYTLIGGSLNYSFSSLIGQINQSAWDEFGNGTVTIRFYANDTLGNLGFAEVIVRKYLFAPIITITSPQDNELFGVVAPNFTIYKAGLSLNTTWYTLDNGINNFTFYGLNDTINQAIWDSFGFGYITITFYVNDSLGKIGMDEITIRKDPDPPEITITFINPANNNSYCAVEPTFIVIVYEPNLLKIWYRVGTTNVEISNGSEVILENSIWDNLPQGKFVIEIFAEDLLGYINDPLNLTFYKDTLAPRIILNDPHNQTYYNAPPPINVTIFDPNFNSLTYTVIGYLPVNIWLENNTVELLNQDIWDNLPQGEFLISITAYDSFGHLNDTYILTLYKDTMAPIIEIISPEDNSYYNSPPILKITSDDPNLHTIWYSCGTTFVELFNNTEQALNFSIWDSITEGVFTVEIFANDSFGQVSAGVNITLNKDITLPLITISSPNNNTYYSIPPSMNIIASDVNLDTLWYTVMGTKIILPLGAVPLDAYIWNNLSQGEFQVLIFANDSAGNLNDNFMLILYKDTLAPLITVNSPYNNTYWNSRPILNVVAYDPNLDSINYKALDYSPLPLLNNTDMLFNNLIWSEISEGMFIIEILAQDSLGNINDSIKLTLYKDTLAPEININLPQPGELFGSIPPDFDITVNESHLDSTWYTLIGELVNITFTGSTGSINQTIWDKFGNGTVTVRFYANDTAGNLDDKDITVRKDIYAPGITIISPNNNELFGINAPDFILNKFGPEIQSTWYTLDNGLTNFTFTGLSGKINQTAWDNFGYEIVSIRFYINNSIGKIGYDEVFVRKDPDAPIIFVNSPLNQTPFASAPFINLTIVEPNLHTVWYRVNDITIDLTDNLTQYLDSFIWNNLPQGTFILELFANDTLGNINNLFQLYLSKDTIGPYIIIVLPNENQEVDRDAPFFELILFDKNGIDISWYTIDGGNVSIEFTGRIGRIDQDLWGYVWDNVTQGGLITISFYSIDRLGNMNYKAVHVIKYPRKDQFKIISNPLGFIFSTSGLVVMLPITLKLTKSRYYQNLNKKEKSKLKKVLATAFLLLSVATLFCIF